MFRMRLSEADESVLSELESRYAGWTRAAIVRLALAELRHAEPRLGGPVALPPPD